MKEFIKFSSFFLTILISGILFPGFSDAEIIDVQVAAGADDGYIRATSSFFSGGNYMYGGQDSYGRITHEFYRFTGITIPQNSTINAAYIELYDGGSNAEVLTKIYADDQNNPTAITSYSDYLGRSLTTASVDQDGNPGGGWHQTSITNIIQELVNSYDYNNGAIQILQRDDGSPINNLNKVGQWDFYDHTLAPKLHIDYTNGIPTQDTTPPSLSDASPSSGTVLPAGTTEINIGLIATDNTLPVACRYSATQGILYSSMTNNLANTGGNTYSTTVTGLANGTIYNYYARCQDGAGNTNATDFVISFSVAASTTPPAVYRSFYYNETELAALRARRTSPTHSVLYNNIQNWASTHLNDPPPAYLPFGSDPTQRRNVGDAIRKFLDNMIFMYHMTDDTRYADAATRWLVYISSNWTAWSPDANQQPSNTGLTAIDMREYVIAAANGYYSLKNYMSSANANIVLNALINNSLPVYNRYLPDTPPYLDGAWDSKNISVALCTGIVGMAMGADYSNSENWITLGTNYIKEAILYSSQGDGGWESGPTYGLRGAIDRLFAYLDVLRRVKGVDLFDDYAYFLSDVPNYFFYMTVYDNGSGNVVPIQMEDTTGFTGYFTETVYSLSYLYKSAAEYNNALAPYAQYAANTYANQDLAQCYIWKSPAITPLNINGLPNFHLFNGIGYAVYRTSWDDTNSLYILFKSGRSAGHAHPNQNTFVIYKNGRPLTCPPGYATTWTEYKTTWPNNCLTVGDARGDDGMVYGYGQAKEPGDIGGAPLPLLGGGEIISAIDSADYVYIAGDASDVYTGRTFSPETQGWPTFSSGDLDKWVRNFVYMKNPGYIVVFDDIVSPTPQRVNWWYIAKDVYNQGGTPPNLVMSNNVLIEVRGTNRFEIRMLEPITYGHEIRSDSGLYGNDFSYALYWPTTNVTTPKFLSVMTADDKLSTGNLVTRRIQQSNLLGVIIDSNNGNNRDLLLFSTNGSPVDQYIELSDYYQPAPGQSYTFNGTQVRANFTTYQVMRLVKTSVPPPSSFTVYNTNRLHLFRDQANAFQINGSGFDLSINFSICFIQSSNVVSSFTVQAQSSSTLQFNPTSAQTNTLPVGFYDLRVTRTTDSVSQNYTRQILITNLGDLWSSAATEFSEQKRDGKINIYDVSRMFSKWGSTNAADLQECDINAGPGNISQSRIDLFDANKIMANWLP